ncbi:MAG: polyprenyl synthetase family protein [Planctomycetaceae bacterium]|nr:polyprenyl synthetase family protein [Planctomycetaceae bacterium]
MERPVRRKRNRKSTSHLKAVPETLPEREAIRDAAEAYAKELLKSRPFNKAELESYGRELLEQMGQPEKFLGFAMVMIGNFFWKRQFLATPFDRRMLLLPHCLKHAEGCPADYDEFGLDCERCGACSIADYKVRAEQLGYKVLVAEGSPVVLKIIISGYIDAILGVACLNVLEKAIDKVLIAGVPSYAVPLHSGDCRNTKLDESWVWAVLDKYEPLEEEPETSSYIPLMRASSRMFEEDFSQLVPPSRSTTPADAASPLGQTEAVSLDWLANGGKRFRPFITLAAYDAVTGGEHQKAGAGAASSTGEGAPVFSDAVRKVAIAIEAFHKASLVHDDIQDGDLYRYGNETLHRQHGVGPAINMGDWLIGLGYRLLHQARTEIGAEAACDIIERMASAHIKLCDGQGAEMAWQNGNCLDVEPIDALKIYALKTSPAFEAALYAGLRMAGPVDQYEELIPAFTRHVGVGFQILNDLKDWQGDDNNKLVAGQDALALRPTVLLALALQAASPAQTEAIQQIMEARDPNEMQIGRLRKIFSECGVFEKAETLVDRSRERAEALADSVEPEQLRQLLYFFVDTILAAETPEQKPDTNVLVSLPIA